jgi:hypothetical protein
MLIAHIKYKENPNLPDSFFHFRLMYHGNSGENKKRRVEDAGKSNLSTKA